MGLVLKKMLEGMSIDSHCDVMQCLAMHWQILSNAPVVGTDQADRKRALQLLNDSIALPLDSIWACNVVFLAMIPDDGINDEDVVSVLNECRSMIPIGCWTIPPLLVSTTEVPQWTA